MNFRDYLGELDQWKKKVEEISLAETKIETAGQVVRSLAAGRLPEKVASLQFNEDILFDHPELMDLEDCLTNLRQVAIENFGVWHIFSQKWLDDLAAYTQAASDNNLEIMAGNALISAFLPNTKATDNLEWAGQDNEHPHPWTKVENLDAVQAVEKYYQQVENIILAWAPDKDETDWKILQFLRDHDWQGKFIVIGEKNGATNSASFWQHADLQLPQILNRNHQHLDFIHDQAFLAK